MRARIIDGEIVWSRDHPPARPAPTAAAPAAEDFEEPSPPIEWSRLVTRRNALGFGAWLAFVVFVSGDFWLVTVIVSAIAFMFRNLGARGAGEASAYSVFNRGGAALPGTLQSEQLDSTGVVMAAERQRRELRQREQRRGGRQQQQPDANDDEDDGEEDAFQRRLNDAIARSKQQR